MSGIDTQQVTDFRHTYNALLNDSRQQYSKPFVRPVGMPWSPDDIREMQMQVEAGIDVTLMKEQFHQLIKDSELGRAVQQLHSRHPGVMQAWDQYRIMLALAAHNDGENLPL